MVRTAAVVLNGKAGALLAQGDGPTALEQLLRDSGLEPQFVPPDAGTLPERIAQASAMRADMVVVGGGDGTVACAAQALAGSGVTLGILPFGTMNLLAHDLGIPVDDLPAAVALLAGGVARDIDVGEVNGERFLCASMLGLPSRLARYREMGRGEPLAVRRWWLMGRATVRALWRTRRLRLRVAADGGAAELLQTHAATVAVNAFDPETGRSFGRSRLDAGELTLYVVAKFGWSDAARLTTRVALHAWHHDSAIEQRRAGAFDIGSRRPALRVMNDGEVVLLRPPLRYTVKRKALRVIGS